MNRKTVLLSLLALALGALVFALNYHVIYISPDSQFMAKDIQRNIDNRIHIVPKSQMTLRYTYLTVDDMVKEASERREASGISKDPVLENLLFEMTRKERYNMDSEGENNN